MNVFVEGSEVDSTINVEQSCIDIRGSWCRMPTRKRHGLATLNRAHDIASGIKGRTRIWE
jgi:hypothetical protein